MSAAPVQDGAGASPSDKPTHLEPSELGTKEYWDDLYDREMRNHAHDPSDTGTVWFDDADAEARVIEFLLGSEPEPPAEPGRDGRPGAPSFLDLGTGNGSLLFGLRDAGRAAARMLGVDYSARSVEFARRIAAARAAGRRVADREEDHDGREQHQQRQQQQQQEEEEEEGGEREVEFRLHDILRDDPRSLLTGAQEAGWDVVLDKGTFDAISLSAEEGGAGEESRGESAGRGAAAAAAATATRRACEAYPRRVLPLVRPGGLFLVTSCNWTEDELRRWFLGDDAVVASTTAAAAAATSTEGREEWGFEQVGRVEYPSFSFGGVKGQTISTLCFRKVRRP